MTSPEKILVIKLSALGDFILSLGAMEAIRRKHPSAHITLLTTKPFLDMAQRSRYFNEIWLDDKPSALQWGKWLSIYKKLNAGGFSRVYDLQMNDRTNFYFRLFRQKPEWSGTAKGASHCFDDPSRFERHAFDNHAIRLSAMGLDVGYPDLSWMKTDVSPFGLKKPYVLLVPGAAPQHPEKRWPALKYGALALKLMRHGYDVAVIGARAEEDAAARIEKSCPQVKNLCGRTSFYDIASLAFDAAAAVGNDTGPMHIIALTGCPVVSLFSGTTDPRLSQPKGTAVQVIQSEDIADIPLDAVFSNMKIRDAA